MTSQNSFDSQPASLEGTILFHSFYKIGAAGGRISAVSSDIRRNCQLICPDHKYQYFLNKIFLFHIPGGLFKQTTRSYCSEHRALYFFHIRSINTVSGYEYNVITFFYIISYRIERLSHKSSGTISFY